uniref:Uncharacterized protein n=2 Tax=Brassica TaxID=3705 RepID=A0A0D3DIN7_BRAOL
MGNAIRVLSNLGFTVTLKLIMETLNLSNSTNIDIHYMLGSEFRLVCDPKDFLCPMTNHYEARRIHVFLPLKAPRVAKGTRTQDGTYS